MTLAWLLWLLAFLLLETYAIVKGGNRTLSDHVWRWFSIGSSRPTSISVHASRVFLLGFMTWLTVHFLTGGWV